MNNRKLFICATALSISAVVCSMLLLSTSNVVDSFASSTRPTNMDCSYYYNNFDSIYEINQDIKNRTSTEGTYKTWGTVTAQWVNNSKTNTYIQSRDANGHDAAILLYDCNTPESTYPVGSVMEIEANKADITLYNNLPEITGYNTIEKAYDSNPTVVALPITTTNWVNTTDSTSEEFQTFYSYGPRRVVLSNVTINSVSSNTAVACLNPGENEEVTVTLYYGGQGSLTTSIDSEINYVYQNNLKATIYGYLNAYKSNYVRVLLRSVEDIQYVEPTEERTLTFNSNNVSSISSNYSTGNYGNFTLNNVGFEYYRAIGGNNNYATLLSYSHDYGDTLGGAIYNTTPIKNIKSISITYETANSYGNDKPTIYYGEHNLSNHIDLNYTYGSEIFTLNDLSDVNYFKIESGDSALYVGEITIVYDNTTTTGGNNFVSTSMGEGKYRANPNESSDPVDGDTAIAPIRVNITNNKYTVLENKTYTYYTYEYVQEHPEVASVAAMTSPMDVANYYSIFKKFPANYVTKGNYNSAYSIFGNNTRCVSTYHRTDGYASKVPYYGSSISYHEFDIALDDTYSSSNRSVGRVVAFETGLSPINYGSGSHVVCYFTDDHYATFQEYNNLGEFLPRFSVEKAIAGRIWGEPTTIIEA